MLPLITFGIGLILFFRNGFQLGNRSVTRQQSRSIGLILMAPLVIEFCVSSMLVYNYVQFEDDGSFSISPDAFDSIVGTLSTIELIAVVSAIGLAIYMIYGRPPASSPPEMSSPVQSSRPLQHPPDIMTVAEAAAYMRVTESEVMKLIEEGRLGAAKIGNSYRIAKIAVDDFMGLA